MKKIISIIISAILILCLLPVTVSAEPVNKPITPKDIKQLGQNVAYMWAKAWGENKEKPIFDRFDYKEKLEYLFGLIGTTVIIVTGIVMTFSSKFPKIVVDICATFHLCEATLATLAITVWHFYAVHWKPGRFPQDTSWLDGKIPMEHLKHEHHIANLLFYTLLILSIHKEFLYE